MDSTVTTPATPSTLKQLVLSDYYGNIMVNGVFLLDRFELNPNGTITLFAFNGDYVEFTLEESAPLFGTDDESRPDRVTAVDCLGNVVSFDQV